MKFVLVLAAVIWLAMPRPSLAQSFSPLFPPSSNQNFFAVCYDQYGNVVPYCDVYLYTGVYLYTNSHYHDSFDHPFGSVIPDSGNTGCCGLPVTLSTTIVGQAETVGVCAVGGLCSALDYGVGYYLSFVDANNLWYLTGATANHGSIYANHWAIDGLSNGIYNTASQFLQAHSDVGQIALNDMALGYGGKFDLNSNWTSPHADHDQGRAVDVNAVPSELADEFVSDCYANGATFAQVETSPYHIHCRW